MTLFSRLVFGHEKVSVGVQKPSKKKWKKVVETENFFRAKSVMEYFSLSFLTPYNYSFPLFLLFLSYFTFMEKESSFEAFKRRVLHLQCFHTFRWPWGKSPALDLRRKRHDGYHIVHPRS